MRFIAFSSKTERSIWSVGALLVIIFGLWDPRIIGSRPDTKKQLLFAATRFQSTESVRGASSADRSSMLQMNETNLRKNALKKSILLQDCTNQWRAVATKQIFDLRQIKSQPNFLTSLLFGPRSTFWAVSCPPKVLFFLKRFFLRSEIPCWRWYRECFPLELQPRNMLSKNVLPYPAVSEKWNVDIIYSSSTWTSITTWPEDRRYSQPDDREQHRREDRVYPTRWDSKMRLVRHPRWPKYPRGRYQVPDRKNTIQPPSTLPRNLDHVPPR